MSVIQRIQERQKWVFGIIALALFVFILEEAVSNHNKGASSDTKLGEANGITINRDEYEHKLDFYEKANGTPRNQLMGSIWDYMVDKAVMQQQFDELGLKVNTDELSDVMFGNNPPQWMQQAFVNPQTGQFDPAAARQQFTQIKKNADDPRNAQLYEGYLEPTIDQTLREKYQSLIAGAVYVPKWMAEKENADNVSLAKISYVSVPYGIVSDTTIKVSDDEITDYVKSHPKEFQQKEETRQIAYLSFDAAPSASDTLSVMTSLSALKPELVASNDAKSFLARNTSEIAFYDGFRIKKAIKELGNDSALINMSAGDVSEPYQNNGNFVLAKMVAKKQIPDSVKVRHILVATSQQQQDGQLVPVRDDSTAKKRLDSAVQLIKAGVSFDSVCTVYSDDPGSKEKGGVYDYFPSGTMMEEFNDFAFSNPVGAKGVVKTVYGYHYIEVLGQKGGETGYKMAFLAKPIVASQETVNTISTDAIKFASTSKTADDFYANAKKINKPVQLATEIKANDFTVQGIGDSRELIKWVYSNDPGQISDAFNVNDKYVVALLAAVNKAGLQTAAQARVTVEPVIRNQKKAQQIINTKIKGTTLDEIAHAAGTSVQVADSIGFQQYIINGIGNEPKILGAAFNKQIQGKVSAPIAGLSGVFVIRGESIFAVPSTGMNPEMLRAQLTQQLKSQISYRSMTAVKDAADIEDNRSKFY